MIYFIEAEGFGRIKIGYSANPERRLLSLSEQAPTRLKLHLSIPGDKDVEWSLHRAFRHSRVIGEWFHISSDLCSTIVVLRQAEASDIPAIISGIAERLEKMNRAIEREARELSADLTHHLDGMLRDSAATFVKKHGSALTAFITGCTQSAAQFWANKSVLPRSHHVARMMWFDLAPFAGTPLAVPDNPKTAEARRLRRETVELAFRAKRAGIRNGTVDAICAELAEV